MNRHGRRGGSARRTRYEDVELPVQLIHAQILKSERVRPGRRWQSHHRRIDPCMDIARYLFADTSVYYCECTRGRIILVVRQPPLERDPPGTWLVVLGADHEVQVSLGPGQVGVVDVVCRFAGYHTSSGCCLDTD